MILSIHAFTQGYSIENFHIDVVLDENGVARFTETIDVNFKEKRRGIIRNIPTMGNFRGHSQSIWLDDIHVAGHRFSVNQGSEYEIKIGNKNKFLTGDQQYVISYSAANGLLNFEDHEEFYWNLFGAEWDTDIKNSSFNITLPKNIEMTPDDYQVFSGRENSTTEYGSIKKIGNIISGKGLITLGKGRALSVGVKFPKEYFFKKEPSNSDKKLVSETQPQSFQQKDTTFPIPILMALGFLFSFFKWGRSKKFKPSEQRYYPPDDMSPSEVGTYFDFQVHSRDLLSLIPYWGERGLLKVRVDAATKDHQIYLEKQMEIAINVPLHEKYFFDQLFSTGNIVYVDDLKHRMTREVAISKKMLKDEILDKELYDQQAVKTFHSWPVGVLIGACFAGGAAVIAIFEMVPTGMALFVLGIILTIIKFSTPKKSERGQRLHDQLKEFQNTVKKPSDTDLTVIAAKDPRYFDKIFPYAVAFGLDKGWLESFKDIGVKPDWYYYNDGRAFGYTDFSNDFNLKKIQNTIVVPPQASSGSSSFGGGGSSGGGFGGGGGSSW